MKRLVVLGVLLVGSGCATLGPGVTVFAQTVPAVIHAVWDRDPMPPDPATQNIVSYKVSLDGTPPTIVPIAGCGPTTCSVLFNILTMGPHLVTAIGTNLDAFGNPQDSPATTASIQFIPPPKTGPQHMKVTP